TAPRYRFGARRVFTAPSLGAFAMITSTRSRLVSLEDFIKLWAQNLRGFWCPGSSAPKIIPHDQAEDEPTRAERTLQRTADLRFPDTRIIARRDFNDAESRQGTFEDHLNCPAIGGLFESERA